MTSRFRFAIVIALTVSAAGGSDVRAADGEGFVPLFNGKDLTGWREQRNNRQPPSKEVTRWKVEDGAIAFAGGRSGPGANLVTEVPHTDFVLRIDWKFKGGGTTGVYVGPAHVKIWDHTKTKGDAAEGSGSIGYGPGRVRVLKKADRALGEWNRFEVRVEGGQVSVWLNDVLVVDRATRAARKAPVTIALQDHATPVWFRNVSVRKLPAAGSKK